MFCIRLLLGDKPGSNIAYSFQLGPPKRDKKSPWSGSGHRIRGFLQLGPRPRLDLIRHCTDLTFGAHKRCCRPREESRPAKVPAEEAQPLVWFQIAESGVFCIRTVTCATDTGCDFP